jgi:hypothetical protein
MARAWRFRRRAQKITTKKGIDSRHKLSSIVVSGCYLPDMSAGVPIIAEPTLAWTFRVRVACGRDLPTERSSWPDADPAGRCYGLRCFFRPRDFFPSWRGTLACLGAIHSAIRARQLREPVSEPFSPDQVGGPERGEIDARHELVQQQRVERCDGAMRWPSQQPVLQPDECAARLLKSVELWCFHCCKIDYASEIRDQMLLAVCDLGSKTSENGPQPLG